MTQTKKKTLIVLGITLLLLFAFIVSMTVGQNATVASADSTSYVNSTQEALNNVMSNGKAPTTSNTEGTAISTREQLQNFLQNGTGRGYLVRDIDDFYWDDYRFTRRLMSAGVTELDGNGFKITLTAYQLQNTRSTPEIGVADGDNKEPTEFTVNRDLLADQALMTYAGTQYTQKNIDLYAGLIGYLRPNQTIKNCNFVYNRTANLSYYTRNCGSFGLVVAYSLGNIDNCSLEIGGNVTFYADTNWTGSMGGSDFHQETMSRHSYAMGGFVGTMSTNARVSNSKVILNGNLSISATCKNIGGTGKGEYRDAYSRTWSGGIVGWMANGSEVYNIVTEGNGGLEAKTENDSKTRGRSFAGIIAGICGGDNVLNEDSVAGKVNTSGVINGIINNWNGYAQYLSNDDKYSPTNGKSNRIQSLVIGFAGLETNPTQVVKDIFMTKNLYGSTYNETTFSIGYDCATAKGTNGVNKGRYYSTNILIKDVLGQIDGSENYTAASDKHAYLAFSGTDITSPVWAVYDIKDDSGILWSKSVDIADGSSTIEYYYDQATSINDAKKFDVTYTEIKRGEELNYEIKYAHGKAVYFTMEFSDSYETDENNNIILPSAIYGEGLTAPSLNLYYDEKHTQYVTKLSDKSYWAYRSDSNNVLMRMTDSDNVSPDTYRSFLYLESPVGRDYNYIQFINTTLRYVSYIYDDPGFKDYIADPNHEGYEPVSNGEKLIDWQQRIVQVVEPKRASINWGHESDIKEVSGMETNELGNIVCYGRYKTLYDGDPAVFDIGVPAGILIADDVCGVNYEYQRLVGENEYETIDSCVNAGSYKLVITGLTNRNYALSDSDEYCIYFEIEKRQIGLKLNTFQGELQNDGSYYIQVPYEANEITLDDKIVISNVLDKDRSIIKLDYIPYGDGELDRKNVGKFEMTISLVGGINSGNYDISSQTTRYIVEIVPTDAIFTVEGKRVYKNSETPTITYKYGYTFQEKVNREVAVTTIEGIPMVFVGTKACYKIVDGFEQPIENEPSNVGEYKVIYTFSNAMYNNYNDFELAVNVVIGQRVVTATVSGFSGGGYMKFDYGAEIDIKELVKFDRQSGETGISAYEYNYADPMFSLRKQEQVDEETWKDTDIWVENIDVSSVVNAGRYTLKIDIVFTPAILSNGVIIDEMTRFNYEVQHHSIIIEILPKTVNIEIKDQEKVYGDDLPNLSGLANALESQRSWTYASGSNKFYDYDNIVILPIFSNTDKFAPVSDEYYIYGPQADDREHMYGNVVDSYNKIDNYDVHFVNQGKYSVVEKTVKIQVFINTTSVNYGDVLPEIIERRILGEGFFEEDGIELYDDYTCEVGSDVGTYEALVALVENANNKNYKLQVVGAVFDIVPKTITIIDTRVGNDMHFYFNGKDHSGDIAISATFAEEEELGDDLNNINLVYNYFEVIDGVVSTEATEHPQYVGIYRVFISGVDNPNYNVVFGAEYERNSLEIEIRKIEVKVEVGNAYRIYSLEDSLTAYNQEFKFVDDSRFYDIDTSKGTLYIDEYYKDLGWKEGIVKIRFDELVKDEKSVDLDGNWSIGEVDENGVIKLTGYRNYDIIVTFGNLNVLSGDLEVVDEFFSLQSYEEVYNGQNRLNDFKLSTSNNNIANALKFEVFQYVEMSSLSTSEANNLAKAGKYSKNEDGTYILDNEDGKYVRKFTDKAINAGQYFYLITAKDKDAGIFEGESSAISFVITKAEREVTENDLIVSVNYYQIMISSKIEGMEISFNGGAFTRNNTFTGLKANFDYTVKVRFAETVNYKQSEEIELNLHTGIDISSIVSTLKKFDKIDFSNIAEYESKVIAFINSVSQDDMATIDQAKLAKLQASYEQLLRGASSVIEGAQKVGATAVGKSGKTANKSVAMAFSTSGLGVLAAGVMFLAKKRKDEQEDEREVKKFNSIKTKRASRVATAVVAVMLICVTVFAFAGCDPYEDGAFSKADLYKVASYQVNGQNAENRDLTIEVKSSGYTLYKYANGKETVDSRFPDVSKIEFYNEGSGFTFDDLYFTGDKFEIVDGIATFNADIRETNTFLDIPDAVNGKIAITVDTVENKLKTMDISYDRVVYGITYNVTIAVKIN